MNVLARKIIGVFAHVKRAEQHGACRLHPLDQGRVARSGRQVAVDLRSRTGREALHVKQVLHRKGHAGERTDAPAGGDRGIDLARFGAGTVGGDVGEGIEDLVVLPDPRQCGFGGLDRRKLAAGNRLRDAGRGHSV